MFTKIGRVVGVISVLLGVAAIVGSFVVAPDMLSSGYDRMSMKQSALWLGQGSVLIFCGLVLGVLCEISLKLEKSSH